MEGIPLILTRRIFCTGCQENVSLCQEVFSFQVYQGKWSICCDWYHGRNINLVKATIKQLVDFCIFLRQGKSLSLSTVKRDCLILTYTFALAGMDPIVLREVVILMTGLKV